MPPLSTASSHVVLDPQPHAPPTIPSSRAHRFLILTSFSATHLDSMGAMAGSNDDNSVSVIRLRVFFGRPYLLCLVVNAGDAAAVRFILHR
jgi:hypothetical protein